MLALAKSLKFATVALLVADLKKPDSLNRPLVEKVGTVFCLVAP